MGAMTFRIPPATHGLLPQLKADWADRGWDLSVLDTFTMSDVPPAGAGGGDGPGGQGGTPASSPPAPAPASQPPAGLDPAAVQAQIDAAKAAGGADALKPFMALVGVASEDELTARLAEWKQADDARKTEAQRAVEAQQEAERKAQEATGGKTAAEVALLKTHALMRYGITDADQVNGLLDLVKIQGDATPESAMAAVEQVKATFPQLFTPVTPDPGTPAPTPPPHSAPPRPGQPTPPASGVDAGRARAQAAKAARQSATKDDLIASFAPKPSPFAAN